MTKRVYIADMNSYGYCTRGIRLWFQRHKLSFERFEKRGILLSELEKYNACGFCKSFTNWVKENG